PKAFPNRDSRLLGKLARGLGAFHSVLDALEALLRIGRQHDIRRHGGLLLGFGAARLAQNRSLVPFRDEGKLAPAPGSPCAGSAAEPGLDGQGWMATVG